MARPTGMKLKVWTHSPRQTVMVFQDGDATDPDATAGFRFDDAFTDGADVEGSGLRTRFAYIQLGVLTNDPLAGMSFSFTVLAPGAGTLNQYPNLAFQPEDRVELFADAPDNNAAVGTPAYHLNNQTGQVRIFHGWIHTTEGRGSALQVECVSAFDRANDVKLVRDLDAGIEIPKIAFNLPKDNPDFFYSYKKTGATSFGTGDPYAPDDWRMTLAEILTKLQDVYADDLQALGVIPGDEIFDSGELAGLTIKPGPIVFEDTGFSDAIRQLLAQWTPDRRLYIDPRTSIWHVVKVFSGFTSSSGDLFDQTVNTGRTVLWLDDTSAFSATPGTSGYFVRVVDAADPTKVEFGSVHQVGGNYIVLNELLAGLYTEHTTVYPLDPDVLPTLVLGHDSEVELGTLSMRKDLDGTCSAVNVLGLNLKTEILRKTWDPLGGGGQGVAPAWNANFEGAWKKSDDKREVDAGRDGSGLPVYKIDTGGTGGNVRVFIAFEDSAYRDDHVDDEWTGCALVVLTADNVGIREQGKHFGIVHFELVTDIGDGRHGYRLEINTTDIAAAVGGDFETTVDHDMGHVADKVMISSAFTFSQVTQPNGRFAVGRFWTFESEQIVQDTSPHQISCSLPQIFAYDGTGNVQRETALNPNLSYPPANANPQQMWREQSDPSSTGFRVFRRSFATARPLGSAGGKPGCDRIGWNPPKRVEVEVEHTTTNIRNARFPATGHAGFVHAVYGRTYTRSVIAKNWLGADQDADYENLALALWNYWSKPNYRGSCSVLGVAAHLAWVDLQIRVSFSTGQWPAGAGSSLTSFWAPVARVAVDFAADRVQFEFNNDSPVFWEDVTKQQKTSQTDLEAIVRKNAETPACLSGSRHTNAPPGLCDQQILSGPRNAGAAGKVPAKDNWAHGLGESGISMSAGVGGGSATHGFAAMATAFRDLAGQGFLVDTSGGIYGGSVAGNEFTQAPGVPPAPVTTATEAQGAATAALATWGLTPIFSPAPIFTSVFSSANSTDTQIVLNHSGFATDELVGCIAYLLDYDEDNRRPGYTIIGNSSSTIHLDLIDEDLPPAGTALRIFRVPAPQLDPGDFPDGGVPCWDQNGQMVVVEPGGTVTIGDYDSGTNVVSAGTGTAKLRLGPVAGAGTTLEFGAGALTGTTDGAMLTVTDGRVVIVPPGSPTEVLTADADGIPGWD